MTRFETFQTLSRVRDELEAARFALSTVLRSWHEHLAAAPAPGGRALSIGDMRRCLEHLELTYILRLFATFEAVLRDYWLNGMKRETEPNLVDLLTNLHGRRDMDEQTLDAVNEIRRWRNEVIHRNLRALRFDLPECAKAFGRFISWLPVQW